MVLQNTASDRISDILSLEELFKGRHFERHRPSAGWRWPTRRSCAGYSASCFRLSRKRDVTAAKAFLRKALKVRGQAPLSITLDGYAASHRAVREMPDEDVIWKDTKLRSPRYLNNMIEQDHRGVKSRIAPMLGFKVFKRATATIAGIELLHRICKGQFALDRLGVRGQAAPAIWTAVLTVWNTKLAQKCAQQSRKFAPEPFFASGF